MLNNEINDKKAQEMKKENYKKYVKQKTPVHALGTNMFRAFLTGGIVCTIGEFLLNWCENMGMTKEIGGSWCSLILVSSSVLLTGFKIYPKIAKWGRRQGHLFRLPDLPIR